MADELLPYFEKELAYIRQLGAEFAKEHPKIAGRLGVNTDTIEDPHASRLIESFAYLNARIQHKLDDEFPELSDALLNVLFPHYQRPLPSMAILQFDADREQLDAPFHVPAKTTVETEPFQGETCRFTTSYAVDMLPISVAEASLVGRPFTTPGADQARGAASVLKLSLKTFNEAILWSELKPEKLRFYFQGQSQYTFPLAELLFNKCVQVFAADSAVDAHARRLGPQAVQPVGYTVDQGLLPYPPNSFIGYRLLTEFFAFPEKFLFVDIDLSKAIADTTTDTLNLYFYLADSDIELEHNIGPDFFALHCTPMVNLFKHTADPIRLEGTQSEYHVIPDARRPAGFEIYSIDKVEATDTSGRRLNYYPFYGLPHNHVGDNNYAYWYGQRRPAKSGIYERDEGTDMYLSLVDINFDPNVPYDKTLLVETTSSNRDLPRKLPYTIDQPKLQCADQSPPCTRIRCLTQPTPVYRPPLRNRARWRLLSHLHLNAASLQGHEKPAEAFKEMLRLYDFRDSSASKGVIESIRQLNIRAISAPINVDGRATLCRGLEVEVELDPNLLTGSSTYVFSTVLEHFFALYCPLNSFTRTVIKLKGKEGYFKKCPPRSGERALL